MGNLRHAEFCKCANCVDTPPSIHMDDTPKALYATTYYPEYIYLDNDGVAWVVYHDSDGLTREVRFYEWDKYPDYKGDESE